MWFRFAIYKNAVLFFCTLALSSAATVANIKIRYDAKTPQFAIFGTRVLCVFYSRLNLRLISYSTVLGHNPAGYYMVLFLSFFSCRSTHHLLCLGTIVGVEKFPILQYWDTTLLAMVLFLYFFSCRLTHHVLCLGAIVGVYKFPILQYWDTTLLAMVRFLSFFSCRLTHNVLCLGTIVGV